LMGPGHIRSNVEVRLEASHNQALAAKNRLCGLFPI
jgi:hypothetical protein